MQNVTVLESRWDFLLEIIAAHFSLPFAPYTRASVRVIYKCVVKSAPPSCGNDPRTATDTVCVCLPGSEPWLQPHRLQCWASSRQGLNLRHADRGKAIARIPDPFTGPDLIHSCGRVHQNRFHRHHWGVHSPFLANLPRPYVIQVELD